MLGRHHPLVRRLRALRRDAARRQSERVLVCEGLHLAREALDARAEIELALVSPRLAATSEGRELRAALEAATAVEETSDETLSALQDAQTAQPVLVLARRPAWSVDALFAERRAWLVAACGLQDPGNLGSVVRSAAASGASGVAACGGADPFHPRAVRASAGAVLRVPVVSLEPQALLDALAEHGVPAIGTDPARGADYLAAALDPPLCLLLGGEGQGLSEPVHAAARRHVRIPLERGVESLSVGAAAAVLLFEIARRARSSPDRS
jgi:TrmH family RNA methyltransferase